MEKEKILKMNKRGVTLIELLIVMIIIAILSAVIFVSMTGALDDARCSDARDTVSDLQVTLKQCWSWQYLNSSNYDTYNCSGLPEQIDQANIEVVQRCKSDQSNNTNESSALEENITLNFTGNNIPVNNILLLNLSNISEPPEDESDSRETTPTNCGNCECEDGESNILCPNDCGTCGDGFCSNCTGLNENSRTCAIDCS